MCPIHNVILTLVVFLTTQITIGGTLSTWTATFTPNNTTITMNQAEVIHLKLEGLSKEFEIQLLSENSGLARVNQTILGNEIDSDGNWEGNFTIEGIFLGNTNVYVQRKNLLNETNNFENKLPVTITREVRAIDHAFTGSIILLVSILYINFGAALDLTQLKGILRKPIGPAIGFCGQFLFMPLLSYGIGHLLFPDFPEMQLGMFFTGVSPAGGASNIWTAILNGNLHLSIAMTTISTFAAFGMMPLWIFTLGKTIFDKGNLGVPYSRIATFAIGLIVPLFIGLAIQRFLPRLTKLLVRILKPFATCLIVFIVVFAIITNLYLFELFSWKIVIAGLGLPWLGYVMGWLAAKAFQQPPADCLAIAIETGIQNTGIAIFLLQFTLPKPASDLTTVIPVSVAIMTPFPLLFLFICQKIKARYSKDSTDEKAPTLIGSSRENHLI